MPKLAVFCGTILALIFVASALYVRLPAHQAVAFTLFGACLIGFFLFVYRISQEDKRRGHDH